MWRGEAELIAAILAGAEAAGAQVRVGPGSHGASGLGALLLGAGDDAALLRAPVGQDLVWTCDEQLEDAHFRRAWGEACGFAALGAKAAGASLSDLAAMGAQPLGALLSLRLPPELQGIAEELGRGVGEQLAAAGCPLAGGNLARSARLGISLDVLGCVPEGRGLLRSSARPGDGLYVSGAVGLAACGLAWLEAGRDPHAPEAARAVRALLRPAPRLELGVTLRALPRVACMDLSDGLAADLPRLALASGVRAEVESALLPGPAEARLLDLDPARLAWEGGEDYQLLVAAPKGAMLGADWIRIGTCGEGAGVYLDGQPASAGFDHFRG